MAQTKANANRSNAGASRAMRSFENSERRKLSAMPQNVRKTAYRKTNMDKFPGWSRYGSKNFRILWSIFEKMSG